MSSVRDVRDVLLANLHENRHKGGLHVSAVAKHSEAYEHVPPSAVGNQQRVLVSELSGFASAHTTQTRALTL